jgi:pimeloyl-ACP methyl ester carboxylesterase
MRRWLAAPLLFALVVVLSTSLETPQVQAQAKAAPPEEETFTTADGIQLHGLFHKSAKSPGTDPVVILLYPPGKDNNMTKGDWTGLANRLNEAGFNVFRFDWRGHGKSKDIKDAPKFWQNPWTGLTWNSRYINGKKPSKDQLVFQDLNNPTAYMPVYLTDIAAARAHLDNKNDAGDVNTSSIYVIGSENAAALGIGWMATEWNRPAFAPTPNQLLLVDTKYAYVPQMLRERDFTTAGEDLSGAVWLSASYPTSITQQNIKGFISGILPNGGRMPLAPKIRDNDPMLFMFSAGDKKSESASKFFHFEALAAKGNNTGLNKLNEKYFCPIEKGEELKGVALLGNNDKLKTEDTLMRFLEDIQKTRKSVVRRNRGFTSPYFISLKDFGIAQQP